MSSLASNVIIPKYFKRRLGRAHGVMNAGVCTGQMAWPLLLTYLQHQYGFRDATLMVAALILNICVAASVFHPVQWHTSKSSSSTSSQGNGRNTSSNRSLPSNTGSGCSVTLLPMLSTLMTNFRILKSPRALIIIIGACFILSGYLNFFSMMPFVMAGAGYTQEEAAWCMSVSGVCNLVTRLVVSSLSDWPGFSKRVCYMSGTATVALSIAGKILLHQFTARSC